MAKKNFGKGVDSLLGGGPDRASTAGKRGRPKTNFKTVEKTSEQGTKVNETRATFIVSKDQLEKIKALAFWERVSIKEVLSRALDAEIENHGRELTKALQSYKGKRGA